MGSFDGIGGSVKKFTPPPAEPEMVSEQPAAETPAVAASLNALIEQSAGEHPSDNVTVFAAPDAAAQQPVVPLDYTADQSTEEETPAPVSIACEEEAAVVSEDAAPLFTVVGVEDAALRAISQEYSPDLAIVRSVANTEMLLQYMVATERSYNVTLSFPAYGIDTNVFEAALGQVDEGQPAVVAITVGGADDKGELYEKITVDGIPYLSCISQCLNGDYLHQVIAEATEDIFTHNKYVYTLVGPRPLVKTGNTVETQETPVLIETLKLNSYELSVLLSFMERIDGITIQHGMYGGRSAITFTR